MIGRCFSTQFWNRLNLTAGSNHTCCVEASILSTFCITDSCSSNLLFYISQGLGERLSEWLQAPNKIMDAVIPMARCIPLMLFRNSWLLPACYQTLQWLLLPWTFSWSCASAAHVLLPEAWGRASNIAICWRLWWLLMQSCSGLRCSLVHCRYFPRRKAG